MKLHGTRLQKEVYYFAVEGECEKLYLQHLQNLINRSEEKTRIVEFKIKITMNPNSIVKNDTRSPNPENKTIEYFCIFDMEGISLEDETRFQNQIEKMIAIHKSNPLRVFRMVYSTQYIHV